MKIASAKEITEENWLKSVQFLIIETYFLDYEPTKALLEGNFGGCALTFENAHKDQFQLYFDEATQPELAFGFTCSPLKKSLPLIKGDFVKEIYIKNDTLFIKISSMESIQKDFTRVISIKNFKAASIILPSI